MLGPASSSRYRCGGVERTPPTTWLLWTAIPCRLKRNHCPRSRIPLSTAAAVKATVMAKATKSWTQGMPRCRLRKSSAKLGTRLRSISHIFFEPLPAGTGSFFGSSLDFGSPRGIFAGGLRMPHAFRCIMYVVVDHPRLLPPSLPRSTLALILCFRFVWRTVHIFRLTL